MPAEAIGESPEAYSSINLILQRAGLDDVKKNTYGTLEDKL